MKAILLFCTAVGLSLHAAAAQTVSPIPMMTDPANLRGERVQPGNGRELPVDQGARGLQQMLRRLNTRASLMLIVAHPDDEDGGMLTLYSRGLGARAAMLTLNRGEGGQNAMSADFDDALGLIRTQELLAADRYFGVDQMFGTEVDFGFSKTAEETLQQWTHERVLYDAVRAVRLYRPLVVASVWIGGVTDGHGHHQVAGRIAQEVFNAAADPHVFPDQIAAGLLPWAPLKVFARVPTEAITRRGLFDYATNQYVPARFTNWVTGEVSTTAPSADVVFDEGATDPLLDGDSYLRFAGLGLALQKSQVGPDMALRTAGAWPVSYHLYGSRVSGPAAAAPEASFFTGIDTSLEGIASLAPDAPAFLRSSLRALAEHLSTATTAFDPDAPGKTAPALAEALQADRRLIGQLQSQAFDADQRANVLHELAVKQVQLNEALRLALDLSLDATATSADGNLPAGRAVPVTLTLVEHSGAPVSLVRESVRTAGAIAVSTELGGTLTTGVGSIATLTVPAESADIAQRPYFHRPGITQAFYDLDDPSFRNAPESAPSLTAAATVRYMGTDVELERRVHDGEREVSFVPPVSVSLSARALVVPNGTTSVSIQTSVASFGGNVPPGTLALGVPQQWNVHPARVPLRAGTATFPLPWTASRTRGDADAVATLAAGERIGDGFRIVGYTGLPASHLFTPASERLVPIELALPEHRRIGYLLGTGDHVPEFLASVGLPVALLTVADLRADKLDQFDSIILGVRTYAAHADLHGLPTQALLDYAQNGGNVILQYQTAEFAAADAPFPLKVGSDAEKVVEESAAVSLDAAPLLTTPNRLGQGDFDGWVSERGHGFLRNWDSRYTAMTETHDAGQAPQRGGLLTTRLGKGHWTYCAFALYRQLPEAVPGSYRLFSNMLALADQR